MRCTSNTLCTNDIKETIRLYVTTTSFVLVKDEHILEIHFDGHKMTRRDSFKPVNIVQSYDIHGVLGFVEGFKEKYMVIISSVQLRGHLFGNPVYVIERVSCLSFDSFKACQKLDKKTVEEEEDEDNESQRIIPKRPTSRPVVLTQSNSFLTRIKQTFTKNKSQEALAEPKEELLIDQLTSDIIKKDSEPLIASSSTSSSTSSSSSSEEEEEDTEDEALEKRLVRQVTEMFSRSMFIYSNTCDITNSFQRSHEKSKSDPLYDDPSVPLWKKVDKRFWWNEHLTRDFITQKMDEWIVPVMQGTLQIEPCNIEGYAFDFVLISRRSRERAGMRYQRRGINEDGQVANFVETEQVVLFKRDDSNHVASFVQTRGSIPLFWSQSPYSLHPVPSLERGEDENESAFHKHFDIQEKLYGRQIVVNLTELSGREAIVGSEYRKHVENLADPNIKYVEFDFHRETKGMRFENISKLSKSLHDDLSKIQYFWEANGNNKENVYCEQSGTFRTNCMDCLDRTNVVQSAFGRSVLNLQLMRFGISEYPEQGIKFYDEFERIFNNVWANNGDMISRMYAGTSALKGDFTRTGKRNITGMMNDASNSLARMYFNTIKDFWRQATVDFILGYHKTEIFRHVPQSTNMSAEPGIERRWAKIRTDAIEISSEIVIADDETKIAGWTLLSPTQDNTNSKKSGKEFEEKVVLLTEKALYICSYNYSLEKVIQFKRLDLHTITSIQVGEYILSSLTPASRSPDQNYGIILSHLIEGESVRWNTGSIRNQSLGDLNIQHDEEEDEVLINNEISAITFKAVRYNILGELDGKVQSCKQQIQDMVQSITKASGHLEKDFIIQKPIISLEQAEKTDGIFKKMGHKIKQAIWI
ncbi:SacI homology domain-containing protein [Mucor mucedo]|uniref:SacI homology domain-containing protein n=1 Tax=Mucor mucedo TaxID=29922 RepID=UPI00222120E3|nr:SacI homology domain-containing protein [Mucor mucedo]KAI7895964.1 SacI homology domain-containing protein [Mucor mucedo]